MKLLNVGCGGQRPQEEIWWNLDNLREHLKEGTPERKNLDAEPRYIECDLTFDIPIGPGMFDGMLVSHVLEHFDCMQAVDVLKRLSLCMTPAGVLCASVPDVDYFERVHDQDTRSNAERLFGESISGGWENEKFQTFFDYALFHHEHKQVLNLNGLWALLRKAGFHHGLICNDPRNMVADKLTEKLNRQKFSAILYAYKS